jgi:cytochrome b561
VIALIVCAAAVAGATIGWGRSGDTTARHVVLGCGIGLAAVTVIIACRVAWQLGSRWPR